MYRWRCPFGITFAKHGAGPRCVAKSTALAPYRTHLGDEYEEVVASTTAAVKVMAAEHSTTAGAAATASGNCDGNFSGSRAQKRTAYDHTAPPKTHT